MEARSKMVQEIDVFFNSKKNFEETAATIGAILGQELKLVTNNHDIYYNVVSLGFTMSLYDHHGLVDDLDIPFSVFRYQLSFTPKHRVWDQGALERLQPALGCYLAVLLSRLGNWSCIVTENLQRLLLDLRSDNRGT
jgi:hypothetical protein